MSVLLRTDIFSATSSAAMNVDAKMLWINSSISAGRPDIVVLLESLRWGPSSQLAHGRFEIDMIPSYSCKIPFLPKPPKALFHVFRPQMSSSLNSLKGGYIGDNIGDYYRGYAGAY